MTVDNFLEIPDRRAPARVPHDGRGAVRGDQEPSGLAPWPNETGPKSCQRPGAAGAAGGVAAGLVPGWATP
jgi:hypothetical protein